MDYSTSNPTQSEMTASAEKYPQGHFKPKPCRWCTAAFQPKAPSHLYCSQECKDYAWTDGYLQRTYSISLQQYRDMLDRTGSRCQICGEEGFLMDPDRHKAKLVVDHCHETGMVRGLLCHNCNRALGLLKDDPERIERAIRYLEGATTIP